MRVPRVGVSVSPLFVISKRELGQILGTNWRISGELRRVRESECVLKRERVVEFNVDNLILMRSRRKDNGDRLPVIDESVARFYDARLCSTKCPYFSEKF